MPEPRDEEDTPITTVATGKYQANAVQDEFDEPEGAAV